MLIYLPHNETLSVQTDNTSAKIIAQQAQWILTHTSDCCPELLCYDLQKVIPELTLKDSETIEGIISCSDNTASQFILICEMLSKSSTKSSNLRIRTKDKIINIAV